MATDHAGQAAVQIRHSDDRYGPASRNRLDQAAAPSIEGARAALESFYYALNSRDSEALAQVWAGHPLAQLNNPLGGVLRGASAINGLYGKILRGPVVVEVTFADIVEYHAGAHAVFAGRETGLYRRGDQAPVPIEIRTSRYFLYQDGRWRQFHHHGSIDDAAALSAYQRAVSQ